MFSATLGLLSSAQVFVNAWMIDHANDAYLQAAYGMHIASTLTLQQAFI